MTRLFGSVTRNKDGEWVIECDPHVMIRLQRLFGKIARAAGKAAVLSDSIENARELEWFLIRYPMKIANADYLAARAAAHVALGERITTVLAGNYVPREFKLALQPREYQRIAADLALSTGRLLVGDDVGLGKAQPLDSHILTPTGWRRMGDLRVGDQVIDPDGGAATITGVFPQGERDVFRLVTADGASAECCDEHLWHVYTANDRARRSPGRVLSLSKIREKVLDERGNGNLTSRYFLPITRPVVFFGFDAPAIGMSPYLLGILLGDGGLTGRMPKVTIAETDIVDAVEKALPEGVRLCRERPDGIDFRISGGQRGGRENTVTCALRKLGVMGHGAATKRIPLSALRMPYLERIMLLRGLMDSDGTIGVDGVVTFTTTSPGLADDVSELVGGLGGFTSFYSRVTNYTHKGERRRGLTAFTLNVRLPFCPFLTARKVRRWRAPLMARAIRAVHPVGRKPVQCIRVSSRRNLYITDGYIVTHNTATAICAIADPENRPALVVTLTHLPRQWQAEFAKFLPGVATHILKSRTPYKIDPLPDVILMNYAKLDGWAVELTGRMRAVIFDEVQELRIPGSAKYQAAALISGGARLRMGLSATPVYNYGGEIHAICDVIAPGELGEWGEFSREWTDGGERRKASVKDPRALGAYLREHGIMLRRTRADVGRELPGLTVVPHTIDADLDEINKMTGSVVELAKTIIKQGGAGFDKMRAAEEFSWRLRQATGMAKAPFVADFVRMLVESGEQVVLYGWHLEVYKIWAERLADLKPVFFTGEQSPNQKEAAKAAFLKGDARVLAMSLRAGAGLDGLQGVCKTVVMGELDWSPGVHEQAVGRVYRDGQKEQVFVYYLISDSGSDPVVADVLGVKRGQSDGIRDPNAALIEKSQTDPERMKKLAEDFLKQRKIAVPREPKEDKPVKRGQVALFGAHEAPA